MKFDVGCQSMAAMTMSCSLRLNLLAFDLASTILSSFEFGAKATCDPSGLQAWHDTPTVASVSCVNVAMVCVGPRDGGGAARGASRPSTSLWLEQRPRRRSQSKL